MADLIKDIINDHNLIDICPPKISPTRYNGRPGEGYVAKRLDRFLLHEQLVEKLRLVQSNIVNNYISDHRPIMPTWCCGDLRYGMPFKFNQVWLEDLEFEVLVWDNWSRGRIGIISPMVHIQEKIRGLKVVVKSWERRKNAQQKKDLNYINVALETLQLLMLSHLPLTEGDKNTQLFHRYANHKRKVNSIWEISDAEGNQVQTQQEITRLAIARFEWAYRCRDLECAEDQVWGINEYPMMFDEEVNSALYKAVSREEILQVLKSLKGDKSPGPDGWTVELFTHFSDIFQEDLTDMVEESRNRGSRHPHINSTYIALIPKKASSYTFSYYRPISLCNLIYNIISKTIATKNKHMLSKYISPEQF
eukprot:PITA_05909